jgi:hypothetical protein
MIEKTKARRSLCGGECQQAQHGDGLDLDQTMPSLIVFYSVLANSWVSWCARPLGTRRIRRTTAGVEEIQMVHFDDELRKTIRRNKLLGLWAAEKLGLASADAKAYSDGLAMDALDPERADVFSKIRKDFENAGLVESREQFLDVLNKILLEAEDPTQSTGGGIDAAAVSIKKNLTSR